MFPIIVLASMVHDPLVAGHAPLAIPRAAELNRRAEELNKRMVPLMDSAIKHAKNGMGLAKHLVEKSGFSPDDPIVVRLKKTSDDLLKAAKNAKSQPLKKIPQL